MSGQDQAHERAPLGRVVAQAREGAGMSVADVASAVNLRQTVLRAIERDDFTLCGGHVYARGHLRAIAKQIGLDSGPLLAAYDEQYGGSAVASVGSNTPLEATPDEETAEATAVPVAPLRAPARVGFTRDVPLERTGPNWGLVVGAVLAVVAVLLVVQLVGDLRGPGRGTSEVATPATSTPSATPSAGPSPSPTTAPATSPASPTVKPPASTATSAPSGVAIALRVTGDSWVSVRDATGRTVFSGLLSNGDARRFRDGKALKLTLGNAGAVQLTVNGKPIGSAGGDGQVVRLSFGPHDPA